MVDRNTYTFFRNHAGWIVGENAKGALDLARAEDLLRTAVDLDVATVEWVDDEVPYDHGILTNKEVAAKFESNEWTGPYGCIVHIGDIASSALFGIVVGPNGTDDPYCRVVEAELALEIADDLRQVIGDTRDANIATLERTP